MQRLRAPASKAPQLLRARRVGRDDVPLDDGVHHVDHYSALVADQLLKRMAQGLQTAVCDKCGWNSACNHEPGDVGVGRDLRDSAYYGKINDSFYAAEAAWKATVRETTESFFDSTPYAVWCDENPGHVGPNLFHFLLSVFLAVDDPVHLGLNLVSKAVRDTAVLYATALEAKDGTGVQRLLSGLRLASLPAAHFRRRILPTRAI